LILKEVGHKVKLFWVLLQQEIMDAMLNGKTYALSCSQISIISIPKLGVL